MHRDLLSQRVKQRLVFHLGTRSSGAQQARFELGFQLGGQDPESRWALELGLGLEFEFVQDSEDLGRRVLGLGLSLVVKALKQLGRRVKGLVRGLGAGVWFFIRGRIQDVLGLAARVGLVLVCFGHWVMLRAKL